MRFPQSILRVVFRLQYCRSLSQFPQQREKQQNRRKHGSYANNSALWGVTAVGLLGYHFLVNKKRAFAAKKTDIRCRQDRKDLPTYSKEEVARHTKRETGIWVSYLNGVYDITDFIKEHPGGDQIMLAAGGSLEVFYRLYGFHEMEHILDQLEEMRIGNLSKKDQLEVKCLPPDPYVKEPTRHCDILPVSTKPFCGALKLRMLADYFYTPKEFFFMRNHLPVPQINLDTYEVHLEVEDTEKHLTFKLNEIKNLPSTTIVCALMCSGNRRSEMMEVVGRQTATHWGPGAMSNAKWTGVKLRDLLKMVEITEGETEYTHVQFEGYDFEANGAPYGASIPIEKALDKYGDVLVAYEMNGLALPPDHGFPLRLIIPGHTGERSVKWLAKIIVSKKESQCYYQQFDHKAFPPSATWENADYEKAPAIQALPVISAICKPNDGDVVDLSEEDSLHIKGYAYSGGGQKIMRVDVTVDGGKTWLVANLDRQDKASPPQHWAWTLWSIRLPIDKNVTEMEIWCKAVDSNCNTQPETFKNIYNFKGVLCNAYHRIKINLKY